MQTVLGQPTLREDSEGVAVIDEAFGMRIILPLLVIAVALTGPTGDFPYVAAWVAWVDPIASRVPSSSNGPRGEGPADLEVRIDVV